MSEYMSVTFTAQRLMRIDHYEYFMKLALIRLEASYFLPGTISWRVCILCKGHFAETLETCCLLSIVDLVLYSESSKEYGNTLIGNTNYGWFQHDVPPRANLHRLASGNPCIPPHNITNAR